MFPSTRFHPNRMWRIDNSPVEIDFQWNTEMILKFNEIYSNIEICGFKKYALLISSKILHNREGQEYFHNNIIGGVKEKTCPPGKTYPPL